MVLHTMQTMQCLPLSLPINLDWSYFLRIQLFFATSQPEFLRTKIGKLWKAIHRNQEKIAIFGNNETEFVYVLFKTKLIITRGILLN